MTIFPSPKGVNITEHVYINREREREGVETDPYSAIHLFVSNVLLISFAESLLAEVIT